MRILASTTDTLSDLLLRQPLFAAVAAAGHERACSLSPPRRRRWCRSLPPAPR